jgi:hypothetical protein
MPTDPTHSLMDDSEFLAELEKLERVAPSERTAEPAFDAGLSGLDKGLGKDAANVPDDEWSDLPVYDGGEEEEAMAPTGSSAARIALAVGGLLLSMAVGAGAAAYVFRDRLAQILR